MDYKEKVIALLNSQELSKDQKEKLEEVFPELKESEDERIRKAIGYAIGQSTHSDGTLINGVSSEEALAWLEKLQIEKLPFEMKTPEESLGIDSDTYSKIVDECIYGEQKPVQEIEPTPIFNIGDILKRKGRDYTFRVDRIQGGYYHCDRNHGAFFPIEEQGNWELVEQKSIEWSKEDEEIIDYLIDYLESGLDSSYTDLDKETFTKEINWLKSLRPQKQEWSKEDERMIKIVKEMAYTIAQTSDKQFLERHGTNEQELKNWSLSCSPQKQWKPSDEQIESLSHMIDAVESEWACEETIGKELLKQLKDLRGE